MLIVAGKSDLEEVKQEYLLQPSTFCQKYRILPPQPFSVKGHFRKDVFVKLATMAAFPYVIYNYYRLLHFYKLAWDD